MSELRREKVMSITREIYEGFQRGEFERWDKVIAQDVEIYSPGYWGGKGIDALKTWGGEFLKALQPRIDLVDEFEGSDRAFVTVNLNWKHVEPFFDLKPTGREGTSIETFILTIKDGKVVRFGVADNTLDLAIYLWERGWAQAHNVHPEAIIQGIERRA
jgi:ketosteroid isomerase-like protein